MCSVDVPDEGLNHIPAGTEQDSMRFHPDTQIGGQFKTYEFFISGIFHLMFADDS